MKKLMMAVAIACAACAVQAAQIKWSTGEGIKPDGSSLAGEDTLTIYTFALANQAAYDALSLDSIWETYGNEALETMAGNATLYSASGEGEYGTTAKRSVVDADKGQHLYMAIITAYDKDLDGKVDMYAVNKSDTYVNAAGSVAAQPADLALKVYGTATDVTWQNVPEPTSGLLLLLGVAGLALRRRRA